MMKNSSGSGGDGKFGAAMDIVGRLANGVAGASGGTPGYTPPSDSDSGTGLGGILKNDIGKFRRPVAPAAPVGTGPGSLVGSMGSGTRMPSMM